MNNLKEFFSKNKSIALVAAVSVTAAYEFSRIHVPDVIENKFSYRVDVLLKNLLKKTAYIGSRFNFGSEPALIRSIMNYFTQYNKNTSTCTSRVNEIDSQSNDIPIKIYFPKKKTDSQLPLMFYYHGGGYVFHWKEVYDYFLTQLVEQIDIIIVSVDYHLAPEFEYPIPIEECYIATCNFLQNLSQYDLKIDKDRIIIAGDSAGANIATIISGKLKQDFDSDIPKLQILMNPPTQYFNFLLPSMIQYSHLDLIDVRPKQILWYMGIVNVKPAQTDVLFKNYHTLLVDESTRKKYMSYVDVDLIPDVYKKDKLYYKNYDSLLNNKMVYPDVFVNKDVLDEDKNFETVLKSLVNTNISPGLADDDTIKTQPKTYMIVSEFDSRKDEALIYAARLSRAGVWVDVAYYDKGFHSTILSDSPVGRNMRNDLINYLKANI